jgi:transposase
VRHGTRLIIERTTAWLQNFRRVLVRHERLLGVYRGLVLVACMIVALRALMK